jgi:hypothetical protein
MAQVFLEALGGLVASVRPSNLPNGASARTFDTDFLTSRVTQRPGEQSVYSYSGVQQGPNPAFSAVDTHSGNVPWSNPTGILEDDENYATATLVSSTSDTSSASTGTSSGGGVAWTNPQNIDSGSAYASVVISASSSSNHTPSTTEGGATSTATLYNQNPPVQSTILSGLPSVAASSATLYITVQATISISGSGSSSLGLYYSTNNGSTWASAGSWSSNLPSTVVSVPVSGLTNLDSVQIKVTAQSTLTSGYAVSGTVTVTNWYATTNGAAQPTSQTLAAAVSGLSIPANATITGLGISFQADYSGTDPSFTVSLNVGSSRSVALTTSPYTWTVGGPGILWGYNSWSASTLPSLVANFIASTTGTSTVNVNSLSVTVYYSLGQLASDYLDVTTFTFSIPNTQAITGVGVALKGYSSGSQTCSVQMLAGGTALDPPKTFTLPGTDGVTTLGSASDSWGASLSSAIVNESQFGVRIKVTGSGTAYLDYLTVTVYLTSGRNNFNFVQTFETETGIEYNLALDNAGNWWLEKITNNPGTLTLALSGTTANSFGSGATVYDRAFVANSNLTSSLITGADIPRQYNLEQEWWDRITQEGPGVPPAFSASQSSGAIADITAYSVNSNVVTLTANNSYSAGAVGTFAALTSATFLNGQTLIVLSTGLSSTQFQVAFTTGNVGTTSDTGTFTPQYTYPVTSITQPSVQSDPSDPGHLSVMLWSDGPGSTSSGDVVTVYYKSSWPPGTQPDETLVTAFNAGYPVYVYITGAPFANGVYQVTSIGNALPPGVDHWRFYYTIQVPTSDYRLAIEPTGQYQITQGTVTTGSPVPGLAPGAQVSISGAGVTAWDGVYPIVEALNSGAFNISQTALAGGTATYTWSLVSGEAPAPGQLVTITNTLNANGILNVTDAVIASATGTNSGTFTITGFSSNLSYPTAVEEGQATTAGTQFIIDPAPNVGSTTVNPIYGNSTGGALTVVGAASSGTLPIGAGTRQGVVIFITRNGTWGPASSPITFSVAEDCNYITASQIPIGPPNVIARLIGLTQAGQNGVPGANFYTITVPTIFNVGGVQYISSPFLIPDNQTTTAQFTFSDSVLLQAEAIDVPGNNLFNLIEIGNPAWILQYADRTFYGGCQNKIQNFTNLSFNGGYLQPTGSAAAVPCAWSIDGPSNPAYGTGFTVTGFSISGNVVTVLCTNTLTQGLNVQIDGLSTGTYLNGQTLNVISATGSQFTAAFSHANVGVTSDSGTVASIVTSLQLLPSPIFGQSLYVQNQTASTQAQYGIITQSAYQDAWNVGILQSNTPYSVRVTCRTPSGATGGGIVVDLTNSNQGVYGSTLGAYTLALSSITNTMATYTGTLVGGTGLSTVPTGLLLRVWGQNLPAIADYEIDRVEVFPTNQPVLNNTVLVSYEGEPEQVDGVTGQITLASQSQDQVMGAVIIRDALHFKKLNSIIECEDAANYEPSFWTTREVSQRVGACGPNAFDYGDEWDLTLHQSGLYAYNGGTPMIISRELQGLNTGEGLWDQINWSASKTFWLANDLRARRFYVGVAMKTPNFWLPNAPSNTNPTQPNVILMCNYDGVPSYEEMEGAAPVHITMFGTLKALDMRRKWSIWQIVSPYAATVLDGALSAETLFICNGTSTGKIYRLLAPQLQPTDDGVPIAPLYTTYGLTTMAEGLEKQTGSLQKLATKFMANLEGSGTLQLRWYPNTLEATYPQTSPLNVALQDPAQNNIERRVEVRGQRIFTELSMNQTGTPVAGYFELGELLMEIGAHPWGGWRGVSS